MADGGCLSFMAPVDLYTLFGNALDNAIEANRKLDAAGRFIELQIYKKKGLVMVQIANPFCGTLAMEGALPRTTKEDKNRHGFGVKSIREIIEKYDGVMEITTEQQVFVLKAIYQI
jgi:sensor histidine kinase regulating citrate/malate metabolism